MLLELVMQYPGSPVEKSWVLSLPRAVAGPVQAESMLPCDLCAHSCWAAITRVPLPRPQCEYVGTELVLLEVSLIAEWRPCTAPAR